MIFLCFSRTLIEANCYVIADDRARSALVVDPGAGSAAWVEETLKSRRLTLGAVLLTHGHIDHVWDSAVVAGDVPVYIPQPDLYRLEDPSEATPALEATFIAGSGHEWVYPSDVRALPEAFFRDGGAQIVEGVAIRAIPAPGHTEGSTVFLLAGDITPDREMVRTPEGAVQRSSFMLTGDVLFRDGVGRTDFMGGDPVAAAESLRTICHVVDPSTVFFAGHGPSSTLQREMQHSFFLRQALQEAL